MWDVAGFRKKGPARQTEVSDGSFSTLFPCAGETSFLQGGFGEKRVQNVVLLW
jgi:hypothetical protein